MAPKILFLAINEGIGKGVINRNIKGGSYSPRHVYRHTFQRIRIGWWNSRWWYLVLCITLRGLWLWLVMSRWLYWLWSCCIVVVAARHTPESQETELGTIEWKSRDFGFQLSGFDFTAFHALRLTGVWWGLAQSGYSHAESKPHEAGNRTSCDFLFWTHFHLSPFHLSEWLTIAFQVHWPI